MMKSKKQFFWEWDQALHFILSNDDCSKSETANGDLWMRRITPIKFIGGCNDLTITVYKMPSGENNVQLVSFL